MLQISSHYKETIKFEIIMLNTLIILSYMKEYIDFVLGVTFIIELLKFAFIFYTFVLYLSSAKTEFKYYTGLFLIGNIFYVIISIVFLFSKPIPFVYELNKVLIILPFALYLQLRSEITHVIKHIVLESLKIILFVNFIVMILQYLVSPSIVALFGVSPSYFNSTMRANRYAGFILGATILGPLSCLAFIISYLYPKYFNRFYRIIFALSVILSTSKGSILALIVVFIVIKLDKRYWIGILTLSITLLSISIYFLKDAFMSKFDQYIYLFNALMSVDSRAFEGDTVENRANHIYHGVLKVIENWPMGTGLGTWGDASAKYYSPDALSFSDSYLIHLIVENGIFFLLYSLIMVYPMLKIGNKRVGLSILFFTFFIFFFTMGWSAGGYAYLLAFIYALVINEHRVLKEKR